MCKRSHVRCASMLASVLAVGLLLSACAGTQVKGPEVTRLSNVDYPPTQGVDVLYALPRAAFNRIARLTASDATGTADQSQLIAELSASASRLGANAVVIQAVTKPQGQGIAFNPSGGQLQAQSGTGTLSVTGLAIRYVH